MVSVVSNKLVNLILHRASGHLIRDIQEAADTFGGFPDMEFFVSSGDFPQIFKQNPDGTTIPMFSSSSSKRGYDLVLPDWGVMDKR